MASYAPDRIDPATIDWANLGFSYVKTNGCVKYVWKDGKWNEGELLKDFKVTLDVAATVLHYGQSCFEGLKAFRMKDGKVRVFRPELNARRMIKSCRSLCMAAPPEELFLSAVRRAIEANIDYVPPYGSNGAMYIRPFVFGSGAQVGLSPAKEYIFIVLVIPVGEYYVGGMGAPTKALIKHKLDRAATYGTGQVKMGGNYAPSLGPTLAAKEKGYTVLLFLDSKENKYVDEFATSNFAALTAPDANGKRIYVTPKSTSALASITNRSLCELAALRFGWGVERRRVPWEEVRSGGFEEVAACGTAVIITPVSEIHREVGKPKTSASAKTKTNSSSVWDDDDDEEEDVELDIAKVADQSSKFEGFRQLYDAYRALQTGDLDGWQTYGWLWPEEGI
ncbi:branched-chain amino acid aminotransferase [Spizellomyces punctatus DAOM BR117]|uniref:Branched-chain amino acid aminotransferase n=1 Tax=Spizellomyces punctatus (strain DAOM BR117) TaxID=645134 RepID=A0A0L0H4M6_SPIPD|nr:branched-chain amino acid aminotransferase [Spizellomyces punctatus DAOM BR117]KNC96147.1 branched-chain amino acid aminotransferase [Spizellomyces punctatus DAOM BR117]|eukprot:XP_016604187.1 branched-chain amino acid aminotransferase [Spizellomyces punctatus DAOM BR117]